MKAAHATSHKESTHKKKTKSVVQSDATNWPQHAREKKGARKENDGKQTAIIDLEACNETGSAEPQSSC